MLCYRDMTFCQEKTCGEFGDGEKKCPRSLTTKVLEAADKWWENQEGGPPIAIFTNRPDCFVAVKSKNINS